MLFNSFEFIFVFLPIVFLIYFFLNKKRFVLASKIWLVATSLFFYSWWNIAYLPLILISIMVNYTVGSILEKDKLRVSRKAILIVGLIFNIASLGYFKYWDFFIENINTMFSTNLALLNLSLPLAISFFTFQQIAYIVDAYRNETKEYDFLNYMLFITFFPQLIAGPIVHHHEMIPQFEKLQNKVVNYKNISLGLFIFSIGLFKKIAIADAFAVWATKGFDQTGTLSFFEAWITSLSYTFQLYFDFSGYSDMAIGAALLFNIVLPLNFLSPYKALNIQEFWKRWHITLNRFLTHYIYIPLGGSRQGKARTYINILIIFLISGIWHGAGWTFIFWGFLHGAASVIYRFWNTIGFKLNKFVAWFITFNFVNSAWVFFRAETWEDALNVLKGMVGLNGVAVPEYLSHFGMEASSFFLPIEELSKSIMMIIFAFIIILLGKNSLKMVENFQLTLKSSIFIAILFIYCVINLNKISEFLYFNF